MFPIGAKKAGLFYILMTDSSLKLLQGFFIRFKNVSKIECWFWVIYANNGWCIKENDGMKSGPVELDLDLSAVDP